jgi:hypothetical protein
MLTRTRIALLVVLVFAPVLPVDAAKEVPLAGIVAASVDEQVVLTDVASGWQAGFSTGPVGWLYPAPGGVLFAPDLVNGATTVFDLERRLPAERLDGVSTPVFGPSDDRYVVISGNVLMVSYPERARLAEIEAEVAAPWQALITPEGTSLLVLERSPDGEGPVLMSAVDLINRRQVYRQQLAGRVVRMALASELGLLALADAESGTIRLVDPATLTPAVEVPLPGEPRDVAFVGQPEMLVVAVAGAGGRGELVTWRLAVKKGVLKLKKRRALPLPGAPLMLAVAPWQSHVAVALESGWVELVELKRLSAAGSAQLPGAPRHLVWCDPLDEGPLLPDWSDQKKPELPFGSSLAGREHK